MKSERSMGRFGGACMLVLLMTAGVMVMAATASAQSDEMPTCAGHIATMVDFSAEVDGTYGDDVIVGGDADQVFDGKGGNDIICGMGGNDVLKGGIGDDELYGGAGRDKLKGQGGDDFLSGGDDNDRIWGGIGEDVIYGGPGDDKLLGEAHADVMYGEAGHDCMEGGDGPDVLYGGDGNDMLRPGHGVGVIDEIYGGTGVDRLIQIPTQFRGAKAPFVASGPFDIEDNGPGRDEQLFEHYEMKFYMCTPHDGEWGQVVFW